MTRPRIAQAIIVEGKYDKIKLESIVDALILPTDGFRIFKDKEMRALIKKLAKETGLVVLTDSDKAGFCHPPPPHGAGSLPVRSLMFTSPTAPVRRAERPSPPRKASWGWRGWTPQILLDALAGAGLLEDCPASHPPITKMDLYEAGLSGKDQSRALRQKLLEHLGLPARLSAGALPAVLSRLISREELFSLCRRLQDNCNLR
ncbi:MAG: DUF4093 domain-containing protein [Oscillospiraceae bacterium]